MRAYYDSDGVYQLDVTMSDRAATVAGKVEQNAAQGVEVVAALVRIQARQQNNMIRELMSDFSAFVADGSQMWFYKGLLPQRIDTASKYVSMLIELIQVHNDQLTPLGLAIITSRR